MTMRIALCDDFAAEQWPSMDRVAAMLDRELSRDRLGRYAVERVCPPFVRAAAVVPPFSRTPSAFKADRMLSRFWRYPRHLRAIRGGFDLFHVIDHSYAHLVHALPPGRAVVTCHDLDAFRSITVPGEEPRSAAFRAMTRRIAAGLGRAARVICDTDAVRRELIATGFVADDRVGVVPLGVDDRFFAAPAAPAADDAIEILHVGSTAPRKRVDVLLRVCGRLAASWPALRLVRVGDPLTPEQRRTARDAGIAHRLVELGAIDEDALADRYRRAALVLQPSDREGFGLPVVEALASATPVVASDLPVLREVGGAAVTFCAGGDVDAWVHAVDALLRERAQCPARWQARRDAARARARGFTWARFADGVARVYDEVAAA